MLVKTVVRLGPNAEFGDSHEEFLFTKHGLTSALNVTPHGLLLVSEEMVSSDDSLAFPGISASPYKALCKKSPGHSDQNKQKMHSLDFDHLQFFTDK